MEFEVSSSKQGGSIAAHFKVIDMPQAFQAEEIETEPESEDRVQEDSATAATANACSQPQQVKLPDGRLECEFCGRKFNPASYARHQPVCQKVFGKTRPQFMPAYTVSKAPPAARGQGTGQEQSPGPPVEAKSEANSGLNDHPCMGDGRGPLADTVGTMPDKIHRALPSRSRTTFASASETWDPICDDLQEKEQRVRQVMDVQMEEIRNMRQQACEDSEEPAAPEPESGHASALGSLGCPKDTPSAPDLRQPGSGADASSPEPATAPAHERARKSYRHEETPLPHNQPQKDTPMGSISIGRGTGTVQHRPVPEKVAQETLPAEGVATPSMSELNLMACEDCGRRFNPSSLERHRAVCRSVFGGMRMRSTFESQNQRLRDVKDRKERASGSGGVLAGDAAGRQDRRTRTTSDAGTPVAQARAARATYAAPGPARPGATQECPQSTALPCEQVEQRLARSKAVAERAQGVSTPRRSALRESLRDVPRKEDLQSGPGPGPGRFRGEKPQVLQVCQNVHPAQSAAKRPTYSRQSLNGTPHEASASRPSGRASTEAAPTSPGASGRRVSSTPPRTRQDRFVKSSASSTSVRNADGGLGSGNMELIHRSVSEILTPRSSQDPQSKLDLLEQEVQEAIQAMTEPKPEDSTAATNLQALPNSSPQHGGLRGLEERVTLLERARLGVKMGQRPQQALAGSMSETLLPSDLLSDSIASASFTASSQWTHAARPSLTDMTQASVQAAGHPDVLSRTQPAVPSMIEAPLSSRSRYRVIEASHASPSRRASYRSVELSGQAPSKQTVGASTGLRLPVRRRDSEDSRPARNCAQPSQAARPGLGREDPTPPCRIADSHGSSVASVALSHPCQGASRMSSATSSQQTPRQWQVPVIPAAPPPSPASPKYAGYAVLGSDCISTPRLTQTAAKGAQSSLQHPVVQQFTPVYRVDPSRSNMQAASTPMRERAVLVPKLDMRKLAQK